MDNWGESHRSKVTKGISINSEKRKIKENKKFKENKNLQKIWFIKKKNLKKTEITCVDDIDVGIAVDSC
jgi:hypothetical protein